MVLPSRTSPTVPKRHFLVGVAVLVSFALLSFGLVFTNIAHRLGITLPSTSAASSSLRTSSTFSEQHHPAVFSLLVTLQFSAVEYKEQFLQYIRPVADYVQKHEPDTLAYEVLLSDKDPLQVLVLERYRDKEVAYLQVHKSSAVFLEFRPMLQALQEAGHVQLSGHSYLDSGVGFGDRA